MRRHTIEPRPDWQRTVEEQGLVYPLTRHPDGRLRPYWDESAYYEFTLDEVEALEETVEELHEMCLAAAAHMVESDRLADLGITDPRVAAAVTEAWHRRAELPSVYGRFDLRYDATGPAKLLEYNADTPTSLVEAASPSGSGWRSASPAPTSGTPSTNAWSPPGRNRPPSSRPAARSTSRTPRPTNSARTS